MSIEWERNDHGINSEWHAIQGDKIAGIGFYTNGRYDWAVMKFKADGKTKVISASNCATFKEAKDNCERIMSE